MFRDRISNHEDECRRAYERLNNSEAEKAAVGLERFYKWTKAGDEDAFGEFKDSEHFGASVDSWITLGVINSELEIIGSSRINPVEEGPNRYNSVRLDTALSRPLRFYACFPGPLPRGLSRLLDNDDHRHYRIILVGNKGEDEVIHRVQLLVPRIEETVKEFCEAVKL